VFKNAKEKENKNKNCFTRDSMKLVLMVKLKHHKIQVDRAVTPLSLQPLNTQSHK
jgi:hypothetical protein